MSGRYVMKVEIEHNLYEKLTKSYKKIMTDIGLSLKLNKKYLDEFEESKKDLKNDFSDTSILKIKNQVDTFSIKVKKLIKTTKISDLSKEIKEKKKLESQYREIYQDSLYNQSSTKKKNEKIKKFMDKIKKLEKDIKQTIKENKKILSEYKKKWEILLSEKDRIKLEIINSDNYENKLLEITNIFESINKDTASLLMSKEYAHISKLIKDLSQSNIKKMYSEIKVYLEKFKEKFILKEQEFLAKKKEIDDILFELDLMESSYKFNDIYSHIEGKEEKIGLFTFANRYGIELIVPEDKYNKKLMEIHTLFANFEYDKAIDLSREISENLNKDITRVRNEYNRLIDEVNYTKKIIKVGADLGYSISAELVKNTIQNGVNIKMTMGDEIVEFLPKIDLDGKAILNIMHHEAVKGDCSGTINNFIHKFKETGIYISHTLNDNISKGLERIGTIELEKAKN